VDLAVPSGRADGVRTGGARKIPIAGGYKVWVKQVGTGEVPVLTLHGGPGFPHYYLECSEDFLPADRIRFWYYDQLGCGFSDQPGDPSLWTIDRFRDEVEQVRSALGLDRFVLYGQSWGGMLALEYALAYIERMGRLMPDAQVVICEQGRHLSMYDDQAAYFSALVRFCWKALEAKS
jgi:proline iminopeptidase